MLTPRRAAGPIALAVTAFATVIAVAHLSDVGAQASDLVTQARQALAANQVDEAIATLEKAVAAAPQDPVALATLGGAQVRKAGTGPPMDAPGWVRKGFETLDEAVRRFPDALVVYVTRGITAASVPEMFGKAPVAVQDLTTAVAMKEKNPTAVPDEVMPSVYLNLGIAHKKAGAIADARGAWERGRQLYPAAPEAQAIDAELRHLGQAQSGRFPNVVEALRATPGCLGVETALTARGLRVIFAWFEGKKALVDWYYSDAHQTAMKTVFPDQAFDRTPLPDLGDDSGPILAIVSVKLADPPRPDAPSSISSIGIELYGPLPGGVAVGGRFAPAALQVRGLREIDVGTARR
jgi:tetratricopeptide (TPR) repeat protein